MTQTDTAKTAPDIAPEALLDSLLSRAKAAGAEAADAIYVRGDSISHSQRLGEIEMLERSEGHDLGLRVLVGRRQAIVSTTDMSEGAIAELVERAVAMAKAVPEDPFCGLAEPDQLAADYEDLDMVDREEPAPEVLIERAAAAEDAARAVEGVTNSEGAEAGWSRSQVWLAATNGFSGSYERSSHSLFTGVIAGEGAGMQTDYDWHSAVFGADLRDPAELGQRAGERAVRRLNPRKMPSGPVPVVYNPRVANRLLGNLLGAINGASIARGTSFLKERMGEEVFAPGITVIEDPHRPRGKSSKPFDAEGLPTQARRIIDDGRLTTWLLDLRTSRQLDLEPTGHASRGTGGPPSPSSTNVYLEPGPDSPEELMADIESGFYVMGLMGMGVNGVTGDYSMGADGYWIEKGEIAFPVSEMTIAGNLKDMYRNLTPASDLEFDYGTDAPTLRIDGMTVAGN